jgi:sulfonate transport system substrate-binding protein
LLADEGEIEEDVAEIVINERSGFDISPVPGEDQAEVLSNISSIFVTSGDVDDQENVDEALETLLRPEFAENAESAE